MFRILCVLAVSAALAPVASAVSIYQMDFATFVQIDHTTSDNPLEASPQLGGNFEIGYSGTLATDTTRNHFETTGFSLVSNDMGGAHYMKTIPVDVTGWDEIRIDILANFVGTDSFNNSPQEYIEYYYALDNGSDTQFFYFTDNPNGTDLNATATVNVAGISSLVVGVNANVDGAGDGWEITSFGIEGTIESGNNEPDPLAGDFNNDGTVDLADYTVWRDHLGGEPGVLLNDTFGGIIGSGQYDLWKSNFGQSTPILAGVSSQSVPEPTAITVIVMGLIVGLALNSRRLCSR